MLETVKMNLDSVIFDPSESDEGRKTINGIPAGYLSPSYPKLVGSDGKPKSIDLSEIVDHFHRGNEKKCVYTGSPSDGVNVIDGDPQNILITNLEPVSKKALDSIPFMPKSSITKVFHFPEKEIQIELFGLPLFRARSLLDKVTIPDVPSSLGLAHEELDLLWVWNELTKVQLLKGLTTLVKRDRRSGSLVKLTNRSVFEFCFKALHADIKE